MGRQYYLLLFVSFIAAVLSDETKQQLIKVVENESDKDCLKEKNVDLDNTFTNFQVCVQGVSQQFQMNLYLSSSQIDPVDAVVKFLCDNPALMNCINELQSELGVCLSPEKNQMLAEQLKPLYAMLDTICEDNGQPLKDLINKGSECLAAKKFGLMQCVQDVVSVMTPQSAEKFEDFKTEEGCNHAKDIQKCVVTILSTCKDNTASTFFDKIFNSLLKNSHCAQYMDGNAV